jgi:hypothetical protein
MSRDKKPTNRDQTEEKKKKLAYIYGMKQNLQNEQEQFLLKTLENHTKKEKNKHTKLDQYSFWRNGNTNSRKRTKYQKETLKNLEGNKHRSNIRNNTSARQPGQKMFCVRLVVCW